MPSYDASYDNCLPRHHCVPQNRYAMNFLCRDHEGFWDYSSRMAARLLIHGCSWGLWHRFVAVDLDWAAGSEILCALGTRDTPMTRVREAQTISGLGANSVRVPPVMPPARAIC
jgi:hypothetical protein